MIESLLLFMVVWFPSVVTNTCSGDKADSAFGAPDSLTWPWVVREPV